MTTHTHETLQRMTGPELNRLVAIELGWTDVRESNYSPDAFVGYPPDAIGLVDDLPDWSGDIGAAWELPRELGKHWYWKIELDPGYGGPLNSVHLKNCRSGIVYDVEADVLENDIAPRAIVIAFLLARAGQGGGKW